MVRTSTYLQTLLWYDHKLVIMDFSVPTGNGFTALGFSSDQDSEVGYEGSGEGDFELVRRKRKRRDTGGAQSYAKFDNASVENKLSLIFKEIWAKGDKSRYVDFLEICRCNT